MRLPLGQSAYRRRYGREPEIVLLNRFFEVAPNNLENGSALLARPATSLQVVVGDGPIRGNFALAGFFDGDLFTVSGGQLYRYDGTTATLIEGSISDTGSAIRWAAANVGGIQRLFISDGLLLQYYQGPAYQDVLTLTPGAIADDVVVIDGVYYKFSSGSLDTGAPAGTVGNPWKVEVGGSDANALSNLRKAINASGVAGTDYSTALVENPRVFSNQNSALTLTARVRLGGPPDPAINVSVVTAGGADGLAWASGSFTAGPEALYGVEMPDGFAALAIDIVNGYVLVVAGGTQRVYYIEPSDVTIDGQAFFEAESEPDRLNDIVALGDQAWLIGQSTTDVYYTTGIGDAPFARAQGRPFPIGGVQGTCIKINGRLLIVGVDNTVYMIGDGPQPISTNGIAERVRLAREAERDNP